jgi:hypothetical protein
MRLHSLPSEPAMWGVSTTLGGACEDKQFGEVCHRAGAFLSPDHSKVALVAVS